MLAVEVVVGKGEELAPERLANIEAPTQVSRLAY